MWNYTICLHLLASHTCYWWPLTDGTGSTFCGDNYSQLHVVPQMILINTLTQQHILQKNINTLLHPPRSNSHKMVCLLWWLGIWQHQMQSKYVQPPKWNLSIHFVPSTALPKNENVLVNLCKQKNIIFFGSIMVIALSKYCFYPSSPVKFIPAFHSFKA